MKNLWNRIKRKFIKLRLQPIRVFCFHQVSDVFDSSTMWKCDWTQTDQFKNNIEILQKTYTFISLEEARIHLLNDIFRVRKYAVLTCDDGYASLKEVLPWLKEHDIPVMLFINPDYAAGKAYRESDKEKYLTIEELAELDVEIGMHGLLHLDVTKMNEDEFYEFAESSFHHSINSSLKHFIPFWAYTWGRHNSMTDRVLKEKGITPVYIDGMKNYNDASCIHRELLDNYK